MNIILGSSINFTELTQRQQIAKVTNVYFLGRNFFYTSKKNYETAGLSYILLFSNQF